MAMLRKARGGIYTTATVIHGYTRTRGHGAHHRACRCEPPRQFMSILGYLLAFLRHAFDSFACNENETNTQRT